MEVWWAGLDALGVWSTNSPSGDSSSSFWSVSEPGGGVLEMEEVPAAGFLLLWRFAVSGGVLCIMIGSDFRWNEWNGAYLDVVGSMKILLGRSLAATSSQAVAGDGESAALVRACGLLI